MAWRPYVAATATALAIAAVVLAVSNPGFWAVVAIAAFSVLALALSLWAWFWVWVNKHSPKLKALLVRTAPRIAAFATPLIVFLVLALGLDLAARVESFRLKDENDTLAGRVMGLETQRAQLQGEADYRRIRLYGKDGHGGVLAELARQTALAAIPKPIPYDSATPDAPSFAPVDCTGARIRGITMDRVVMSTSNGKSAFSFSAPSICGVSMTNSQFTGYSEPMKFNVTSTP